MQHKILKIRNLRVANFFLSVGKDGPMFSPKYGAVFIYVLQLIKRYSMLMQKAFKVGLRYVARFARVKPVEPSTLSQP